jgi:outer membrane protein assembly factor BamE (lipoprotein component of BamABCDE complex)
MRKVLLTLIPLGLAVAGYLFWCYAHTESYCFFYPSIDTQFAAGFSDQAFSQVATGMTMQAVQQKLGLPLAVHSYIENTEQGELWSYTLDGKCKWGDWAWLRREIDFRNGKVVEVTKRVSYD